MQGIILLNKPKGITSFSAVARVRRLCGIKRVGHTGTLDPLAEGVLPILVGRATALSSYITDGDKAYTARVRLGITTDTEDITGTVLEEKEVSISGEALENAVSSFKGKIMQVPPMYSAVKVNGKKLYELARAGKEVEREARKVTFHEIEILSIELPVVKIRVLCSKGTYIRTLCNDIGEKLGCYAAMKSLLRTRVGVFDIKEAITLEELEKYRDEGKLAEVILPPDRIFMHMPAVYAKTEFCKLLDNGNTVYPNMLQKPPYLKDGTEVRMYGGEKFYGIFQYVAKDNRLKPVKMFL